MHMANAGVVNATGDAAPEAWRRFAALMIQSFEAPARGPLPASPEHDALYKAMLRASPNEPGSATDRGSTTDIGRIITGPSTRKAQASPEK